jgi:hypothetical protein
MTKEQYLDLKAELKELSIMIKTIRHNSRCNGINKRKLMPVPVWKYQYSLERAVYEFRHKHIYLSIVRGKSREQIEIPKPGNEPDERYITKLMETYEVVQAAVCIGS